MHSSRLAQKFKFTNQRDVEMLDDSDDRSLVSLRRNKVTKACLEALIGDDHDNDDNGEGD
jgi:hypothetical protein